MGATCSDYIIYSVGTPQKSRWTLRWWDVVDGETWWFQATVVMGKTLTV